MKFNQLTFTIALMVCSVPLLAQGGGIITRDDVLGRNNAITTTVPFLMITPDARGGAMGDVGAATTPDVYSGHWNPAKYAFIEKNGAVALNYTPWLRQLVSGINLSQVTAYSKINKRSAFAGGLRFFSLGQINFTDNDGNSLGTFNPNEFALDGMYSVKLSNKFSMGVGLRFIYSNLVGNINVNGVDARPGIAGAADLGMYYQDKIKLPSKEKLDYAIGLAFTNMGNKMTYTSESNRDFIPINMRLGGFTKYKVDEFNSIGFAIDFNKLLVPTPPIYARDSMGRIIVVGGQRQIAAGKDNRVPVIEGMLQSFSDAPGGFREELREINYSLGVEWWYQEQFAVRAGYFNEHVTKGNRRFLTFGIGVRYNVFGLDVSYLAPVTALQRHPLQNTLRFSLVFDFASFKVDKDAEKQNKPRKP